MSRPAARAAASMLATTPASSARSTSSCASVRFSWWYLPRRGEWAGWGGWAGRMSGFVKRAARQRAKRLGAASRSTSRRAGR